MGTVNGLIKVDQRKPFFDNKVMELIYSISDEYRKDSKLYSAMLLKFFPEFFKDIPWQKTGKTINKKLSNSFSAKVIKRLKRVPYKFGILKDTGSYVNYPQWIKGDNLSKELCALLDKNSSEYSKYTDEDFKAKYLTPHLNGRKNFSKEVLSAVSIEIYLKSIKDE